MSKRTYTFDFPYRASWMQRIAIHHGLNDPQYRADIMTLKPELVAKLQTCTGDTEFTKADFDGIPDSLWVKLKDHLG